MNRFLRPALRNLESYTPGEQPRDKKYIKLNTNESPYPPGPLTLNAIHKGDMEDLRLYPDPTAKALREKIAKIYGKEGGIEFAPENVFCSNGSDDIINFAFSAFGGNERRILFPEISYGFYDVFADYYGANRDLAEMNESLEIDLSPYYEIGYGLKILANPNAPTGIYIGLEEIRKILESDRDAVVLIDEAYIDFGGESAVKLIEEFDNLLVSRTFSKSFSLAGARFGFAIGSKELIEALELIKYSTNPYSVNRMTERVALASLEEVDYYYENCRKIIETREGIVSKLKEEGFTVLPSQANFIFLKTMPYLEGRDAYEGLRDKGILVRFFSKEKIKDYLRITIGSSEEMEALIAGLIELKTENRERP